jgi:hypothetical protein
MMNRDLDKNDSEPMAMGKHSLLDQGGRYSSDYQSDPFSLSQGTIP